jgi:hypothetical protein
VGFQPGPALEAIFVGYDQLRIAKCEVSALDRRWGSFAPAWMVLLDVVQGMRIRSLMALQDLLGLVFKIFEIAARR